MDIVAASHFGKILEVIEDERLGEAFNIYKNPNGVWTASIIQWNETFISATGVSYMEAIAELDKLVRKV